MAIAVNLTKKTPYILLRERDVPEEDQTIWMLGTLSVRQRAEIRNALVGMTDGEVDLKGVGSAPVLALRFALVGWKNFRDGDGNEVKHTTAKTKLGRVMHTHLVDSLADEDAMELAGEIMLINKLADDPDDEDENNDDDDAPKVPGGDVGKSETPSISSPAGADGGATAGSQPTDAAPAAAPPSPSPVPMPVAGAAGGDGTATE